MRVRAARARLSLLVSFAAMLAATPAPGQVVPAPDPDTARPDFDEAQRGEIEPPAETVLRIGGRLTATRIDLRVNDALSRAGLAGGDRDEEEENDEVAALSRRAAQGSGSGRIAAWGSAGFRRLKDEGRGRAFNGTLTNPLVGVDYALPSGWVFGLSAGLERSDLETEFNNGRLESLGALISPYVGRAIGQNIVVDAGLGYVRLDYDRTRAGGTVRGSFDADRLFAFANVTGYAPQEWHGVERLSLRARLGFRYSNEDQSSFAEGGARVPGGTIELGQASFGGEARYFADAESVDTLELFARATGAVDVVRSERVTTGFAAPADDRTEVVLALGAVAVISDRLSADLTLESVLARENFTEIGATLGVRLDF